MPGGFYHVTLRGNHRQAIFFRTEDRDLLDEVVAESVTRLEARIHAYCWMTNHLHLLIQISNVPLGRVILRIASRYARTVQMRLVTTGHLFERRYHSLLVDADNYLLTLLRYIHLNPVRAGLVTKPEAYPWSSHAVYLGLCHRAWVTTDFALLLLGNDAARQRAQYLELMQSSEPCELGSGILAPHRTQRQVLGDDKFVARITADQRHQPTWKTLDELLVECCQQFDVEYELLCMPGNGRQLAQARAWIAHESVANQVATVCAIARKLGRTESAVRALMARYPRVTSA
jgi:REP element-mobilizing transposase RayT